jgi:hypothetical protein
MRDRDAQRRREPQFYSAKAHSNDSNRKLGSVSKRPSASDSNRQLPNESMKQ